MTTPPIDVNTVLTLARHLSPADQLQVAATLLATADAPSACTTAVTNGAWASDVHQSLVPMMFDQLVVRPPGTTEDARARLQAWRGDDADDEEGEPWDTVLQSLDANRFSTRRLFEALDGA